MDSPICTEYKDLVLSPPPSLQPVCAAAKTSDSFDIRDNLDDNAPFLHFMLRHVLDSLLSLFNQREWLSNEHGKQLCRPLIRYLLLPLLTRKHGCVLPVILSLQLATAPELRILLMQTASLGGEASRGVLRHGDIEGSFSYPQPTQIKTV